MKFLYTVNDQYEKQVVLKFLNEMLDVKQGKYKLEITIEEQEACKSPESEEAASSDSQTQSLGDSEAIGVPPN